MRLPITAIVLAHNEELNLPACLKSLSDWCEKIFVVDSGSSDRTLQIVQEFHAEALSHPFETHAKQWNWALQNLPISTEWILALDADQRVTPEMQEELGRTLPKTPADVAAYYLPRKQFFRGRWIRFGGYWPKYLLKLFRKGAAWSDEQELVDFRFYVRGKTRLLNHPLIEQNEKEWQIVFWLEKHLRFVQLRAQEEYLRRHQKNSWAVQPSLLGTPDQRILWWKQRWYVFPPLLRPFPYFLYRYILQLGILDGWEGFLFHFLRCFWFELMIGVRLKEIEREKGPARRESPS